MKEVLVVGSVGLDTVETPFGEVFEVLGGSAVFFSLAAAFFTRVNLVGVIGEDFPEEYINLLKVQNIDLTGLHRSSGKTFRWKGRYGYDLNEAITIATELNVFEDFSPDLPEVYKDIEYVFLANIDPELQLKVINQMNRPKLIVCDTMNFWIERKREALIETLHHVDIAVMNDAEIRELCNEPNIIRAGKKILSWGLKWVIVKKGEHGALMFADNMFFAAPAYPLEDIFDPTGAGDTFAGGFLGYLASKDSGVNNEKEIRKAVIQGATMASFVVEDFSVKRLMSLTPAEIKDRYLEFKNMVHFEEEYE